MSFYVTGFLALFVFKHNGLQRTHAKSINIGRSWNMTHKHIRIQEVEFLVKNKIKKLHNNQLNQ